MSSMNTSVIHPSRKKRRLNPFVRRNIAGYLLCSPMILGLLIFVFYPMFQTFIYSFQSTNGISGTFNSVTNYKWIFKDDMFWDALKNTAIMSVMAVLIDIVVCFVLASLINSLSYNKSFFKSIYFLPNVVSSVATALLFNFLFYPTDAGVINYFLSFLGIKPVGWLVQPGIAKFSIVLMGLWRSVGYDTILFLAGLQSIPREYYEAAKVDGASGLQRWWHITIPNMKPIFAFMIIMQVIGTLKRFDDVWLIGGIGGNPGGSLQTVVLYIYRNAWISRDVGIASAASVVLFAITLIVTIANYRLMNKER